jgi:hypothetical protein
LVTRPAGTAFERHYRVNELCTLWGFSRSTILKAVAHEPGVLHMSFQGSKRKYDSISIPASVMSRLHDRLCQQPLEPSLAASRPPSVILLRDRDRGVSQKPRNVLKLHPSKQLPDRKGITQPVRPAVGDAAA